MARDKFRRVVTAQNGLEVGDPSTGNYVSIAASGIRLHGTATQYEDLRVDAISTRVGAIAPTDETGFRGDSNHYVRNFVHTQADEIQFTVQMPHSWAEGTTIYPHFHFSPWGAGSASTNQVQFIFEYYWANVNEQFPASPTTASLVYTWTGNKQWYHFIATQSSGIAATGKTLSSILKCRLYRDNTAASNLADKATGHYFDIHYEADSWGSNSEYIKG